MSYRPYQQIQRRRSRQIHVGSVPVGGDAPITVQTMTNTLTTDVPGTVAQIRRAEEAGVDIVRVSCPDQESALALKQIVPQFNQIILTRYVSNPRSIPAEQLLTYCSELQLTDSGNVTLAENPVAALAAAFAVGVDVADDEDGERLPRIAGRVFSEGEAEECGAHASVAAQAAVWAIKEAGLKLRIGGVFSPGARSVRVKSLEPVQVADPRLEIALFRVLGAAVAVARERSG